MNDGEKNDSGTVDNVSAVKQGEQLNDNTVSQTPVVTVGGISEGYQSPNQTQFDQPPGWTKKVRIFFSILLVAYLVLSILGGPWGWVLLILAIPMCTATGLFILSLYLYDKTRLNAWKSSNELLPNVSKLKLHNKLSKIFLIVCSFVFVLCIICYSLSPLYFKTKQRNQKQSLYDIYARDVGFKLFLPTKYVDRYSYTSNSLNRVELPEKTKQKTGVEYGIGFTRSYRSSPDKDRVLFGIGEVDKRLLPQGYEECGAGYQLSSNLNGKKLTCTPIEISFDNGKQTIFYSDRTFFMDIETTRIMFSTAVFTLEQQTNIHNSFDERNSLNKDSESVQKALSPVIDFIQSFEPVDIYSLPISDGYKEIMLNK